MSFDPLFENARRQQEFAAGLVPPGVASPTVSYMPPDVGGGVTVHDGRDFAGPPIAGGIVNVGGGGGTTVKVDSRHDESQDHAPRRADTPEQQLGAAMAEGYHPDGYVPGVRR